MSFKTRTSFSIVFPAQDSKFQIPPWPCDLVSHNVMDYVQCLLWCLRPAQDSIPRVQCPLPMVLPPGKSLAKQAIQQQLYHLFTASLPFSPSSLLLTTSISSSLDEDLEEDLSLVDSSSILYPSLLSTKLR